MPQTHYTHIAFEDGPFEEKVPVIAGTTMKVIELVVGKIAYGWSAEELHFQYPHLSMGQIHAALTYYFDHKEALDADIERREAFVERMREKAAPSPLRKRLGKKGVL